MPDSFGARLRQHREAQAIALITIAEQTKIKFSLLESLERDDVSNWPSGIFRRAFIRAYAHAIGLDPDVVVREFLELYPEPAAAAAAALAAAAAADNSRVNAAPPTRLWHLVDSAIGSLSLRRRSAAVEDSSAVARARDPEPVLAPVQGGRYLDPSAHPPPPPDPLAETDDAVADSTASNVRATFEPNLLAVADLCTEFGRVQTTADVQPLLEEAANILEATGLIVWIWDGLAAELRPALVHGYSDKVLAQLPPVGRETDNATAAAFRTAEAHAIAGTDHSCSALVVPLFTPAGCAGVLAIELQCHSEPTKSVRAVAAIVAALLAQLIGDRAEVPRQVEMADSAIGSLSGSSLHLTPAAR